MRRTASGSLKKGSRSPSRLNGRNRSARTIPSAFVWPCKGIQDYPLEDERGRYASTGYALSVEELNDRPLDLHEGHRFRNHAFTLVARMNREELQCATPTKTKASGSWQSSSARPFPIRRLLPPRQAAVAGKEHELAVIIL